ncbi:hypothetical protein E2C01_051456 [Portunus trituberculatus]|uniref:Uncharacterized protein n=1 Tax=Portunus trituberculatus TaxID=210409 RepID=A0A5B7GIS1_PORTR|nr:hypothetical protein [Portunus trituberculatus]
MVAHIFIFFIVIPVTIAFFLFVVSWEGFQRTSAVEVYDGRRGVWLAWCSQLRGNLHPLLTVKLPGLVKLATQETDIAASAVLYTRQVCDTVQGGRLPKLCREYFSDAKFCCSQTAELRLARGFSRPVTHEITSSPPPERIQLLHDRRFTLANRSGRGNRLDSQSHIGGLPHNIGEETRSANTAPVEATLQRSVTRRLTTYGKNSSDRCGSLPPASRFLLRDSRPSCNTLLPGARHLTGSGSPFLSSTFPTHERGGTLDPSITDLGEEKVTCYQLDPAGSSDHYAVLILGDMGVAREKETSRAVWLWDRADPSVWASKVYGESLH